MIDFSFDGRVSRLAMECADDGLALQGGVAVLRTRARLEFARSGEESSRAWGYLADAYTNLAAIAEVKGDMGQREDYISVARDFAKLRRKYE